MTNTKEELQEASDEFETMLRFIALSHAYWKTCDKDFISDKAVDAIRTVLDDALADTEKSSDVDHVTDTNVGKIRAEQPAVEPIEGLEDALDVESSMSPDEYGEKLRNFAKKYGKQDFSARIKEAARRYYTLTKREGA